MSHLKLAEEFDYTQGEIEVLTHLIYSEGRGNVALMRALACVIINRREFSQSKPEGHWWGNDIISICQKPYQWKSMNRSDPKYIETMKIIRQPSDDYMITNHMANAKLIAEMAVYGGLADRTRGATHFIREGEYVFWASGEHPVAEIEGHNFYKLI